MDYSKCESASDFETKFKALYTKLNVPEGEETWGQIDGSLKSLIALVKSGATKYDTFVLTMKQATKHINSAVTSERTRLSATGILLVEEMARYMETRFSVFSDLLVPTVMKTCGRANKVFVTRGVNCLTTVITYAHIPEQTPRICEAAVGDNNKTMRASAAKLVMSLISCCTAPELTPHLAMVERAIAQGVVDANPDARTTARQSYEIYVKRFSDRVEKFKDGLSATARKYLKIDGKASSGGRSYGSGVAAFKKRLPLRDRIGAQQTNSASGFGKPQANKAVPDKQPQAPGTPGGAVGGGPRRLKPMRPPMARNPVIATPASNPSNLTVVAEPVAVTVETDSSNNVSAPLQPAVPPKLNDPEQVVSAAIASTDPAKKKESTLFSPHGEKPALVQLFNDGGQSRPTSRPSTPDPASTSVFPIAASGSVSATETRVPSPIDDNLSKEDNPDDKKPMAATLPRAKRGQSALTFSSLSSGNGSKANDTGSIGKKSNGANKAGGPRAVRPAPRNIVSKRMEEALRARRPSAAAATKAATSKAQRPTKPQTADRRASRRMTLRSDTRELSKPNDGKPGYLRATAASTNRLAETATTTASRGTKRRKQPDTTDNELPPTKTAKPSAAKV